MSALRIKLVISEPSRSGLRLRPSAVAVGARRVTAERTCPRAAKRRTFEPGSSHGAEGERSFHSQRVREQRASSGGLPRALVPPARPSPTCPAPGQGARALTAKGKDG